MKENVTATIFLAFMCSILLALSGCDKSPEEAKTTLKDSNTTDLKNAELVGDEVINTIYGKIELQHTFMTDESSQKLFDAMDFQRASQAYIWSIPLVGARTWHIEQDKDYKNGELGVFAIFETLKEKRGIVTGNMTTPYVISWYDLTKGALVVDYPAGATAGGVMDYWQRPVIDMGFTGPDQGKGGKYIIVGPEDDINEYEEEGVFVAQSDTNNVMMALRLIDPSPEFAKTFKASIKMGTFGKEMKSSTFNENIDKEWSGTPARGIDYWKTLHEVIQSEPVREQDKVWMAMLEPLGIKKGQPFDPNERQKNILIEGAAMGELMTRNLQVNPRFAEVYWKDTSWYKSFDFTVSQSTDYKVELDERATWYYEAVTSSEGMVNPTPGKGQVYMTTKRDNNGDLLRADETYKLSVPKDVPVAQFWSVVLYSEATRRPYDNGGVNIDDVALNSRMEKLQYNDDGSVDLYIGEKSPKGLESNFLKTVGEDGWFIYFRLYAPTEPFFDKSFSLPDFEILEK